MANNNSKEFIEKTIESVKTKINELSQATSQFADTKLAPKAQELSDYATSLLSNVVEKLKTINLDNTSFEQVKKLSEFVVTKANDITSSTVKKINALKEDESFKNTIDNITSKITTVSSNIKTGVSDFMAKPEVNEKIEKAKDATIDIAFKAAESLKQWLRPEDKNEDKK